MRGVTVACLGAVALLLFGCRLDMHVQPKYLPYQPTDFFGDGRSERQPVPGTVARGQLRLDELMFTGRENGVVVDKFPFPITKADLDRGRERYNVYCTPCHDYTGTGRGMIVQRGFPQPPSYHIQRLRDAPAGHFYEVMTNGFGAMYSYAARVEPADRWRIAAYIRVLQLARNATIERRAGIRSRETDAAIRAAAVGTIHGAIAMSLPNTLPDNVRLQIDRAQRRGAGVRRCRS